MFVYFFFIGYLLFVKLAIAQQQIDPFCDPSNVGTVSGASALVREAAEANPDACLCSSPCTVDKVRDLVRMYYIKRGIKFFQDIDIKNPASSKLFNYKGHVKFLTHGYSNNGTTGFMQPSAIQLTKIFNGYIVLVDYGAISNCTVNRSTFEIIPSTGYLVAEVIRGLNLDPRKIELIGRSLGGHLVGYAGAALNGTVGKITALDPALRVFDSLNIGLNKTCAQFVQVLSTDPGGQGTALLRGHAHFFANRRSVLQPGCNTTVCGHGRSSSFYYASLFPENKFISVDCILTDVTYLGPNLDLNAPYVSIFGHFNDGKSGIFCFETTPCFPFARTISYESDNSSKGKKCSNRKTYGNS